MGSIPNYFQLVGTLHSTYTVKIELLYELVFDVINFTVKNKYLRLQTNPLCDFTTTDPNLKSNYLSRNVDKMPKTASLHDIPTVGRLDTNYKFEKTHFKFLKKSPAGLAFTNVSCKNKNNKWLIGLSIALCVIFSLPIHHSKKNLFLFHVISTFNMCLLCNIRTYG